MLKSIWAARWYVLLGLLTFLITLALTTPLHFVWRMLAPQLSALPVHVQQVSGTVWNGRLQFQVMQLRELGLLDARWELSFLSLLTGTADVRLQIDSPQLRLQLPVRIGTDKILHIQGADGYFSLTPLRPLLQAQRTKVEGNLELSRLLAEVDLNTNVFRELSGQLIYSGGASSFLVDNKPVNANLPMMVGQLGREQDRAALDLTTDSGDVLLRGYLQADGWAGIALRRRFLDVIGQQWPAQAEADTVIFEVSQKVL